VQIGDREGPLYIGSTSPYAANNNFGGLIDELHLWDTALTLNEIRVIGGYNLAPTANAGPDHIVYTGASTNGQVMLDGSASSDPEGDAMTYSWSGPFGTATGATPTVTLPLGIHTITLTVTDAYGQSSTATTRAAVVQGVDSTSYAQMQALLNTANAQVATLTQKNTQLTALLQSLLTAFDQIQSAAQGIVDTCVQQKQTINTALTGN
jgi:hypothetical protein